MSNTHDYIIHVADRAASREVDALFDYYSLGQLIRSREITYKRASEQLVAEFAKRDLSASTAKVYLSQGKVLAQLFDTFDDVETFADDECKGSRSLKRIYDACRAPKKAAPAAESTDEKSAELVDVVLAGLANLKDAGEIARVRDAAIAMLTATAAA